jgi:hypothetical protein
MSTVFLKGSFLFCYWNIWSNGDTETYKVTAGNRTQASGIGGEHSSNELFE